MASYGSNPAYGGVFFVTGVPVGTEFGIDQQSFVVGENFRGVKMIPKGVHFIYCAARGPYNEIAPRVGFVHYFTEEEIVVREWDNEKEELRPIVNRNMEIPEERIRENLKKLSRFLAPFDFDNLNTWTRLTRKITEETVSRHAPPSGIVRNTIELQSCPDEFRPKGNAVTPKLMRIASEMHEDNLLPKLESIQGTAPRFSQLPPRCPTDAIPSEVSRHYMDCINAVDILLKNREEVILEEIEFAFVLFLCGHSVEALNHWRNVLVLLSNSEKATTEYRTFYCNYLKALQYQLPELPIELMAQTSSNTVYLDVRKLLSNCYYSGLTSAARILEKSLKETLLWEFGDLFAEDPEEMPMIIEI